MELIYILIIILLIVVIILLAFTLLHLVRKSIYLSDKEKEYISFVFGIFKDYGDDLGIQSKEQHIKLVEELDKINNKLQK